MKNKIIYIIFLVCYAFTSCSSQDKSSIPIKVESITNDNDSIKIQQTFGNKFFLLIPTQLKIGNISKSNKVLWLISFYANKNYGKSFADFYTKDREYYFKQVKIMETGKSVDIYIDMFIPLDSLTTQNILDIYHLSVSSDDRNTKFLGTYTEVIQRMKEIKMTNDSTLYNQVFKDIIFSIPVHNSVEDRKPRFINYNWLTNETYDKYPNSQIK